MENRYRNKIEESEAVYLKRLKKMSGEEKLKITSDLFEVVKEIARAGILYQNPDISKNGIERELKRRFGK